MKNKCFFSALIIFTLSAVSAFADGFIVLPDPVEQLSTSFPLEVKFHHVTVSIKGQHAVTDIDQEFHNPTRRVITGEYVFPVPKNASIKKFSVLVNGREVRAELLGAREARELYMKVLKKQHEPALLEYDGMDLFRAKIAAIGPGSSKKVRIVYDEILTTDNHTCEYLYPLNTEKFSSRPLEEVSITVTVENPAGVKNLFSTSHEISTRQTSANKAVARYEAKNVTPDRDFRLYFSTSPSSVSFSLLPYREKGKAGYFLLSMSPGIELPGAQYVKKDITFVLDVSGSMLGEKLEKAKRALRYCVDNLNAGDRFQIIGFSTDVEPLFSAPREATPEKRKRAMAFIEKMEATGGTNISGALEEALKNRPDRPHLVLFITDGKPTIGITDEEALLKTVERRNTAGTRIFTFGIGYDINTHLLDRVTTLTRASGGYITPDEDIESKISSFYRKIQSPVLMNPSLAARGARLFKVYPNTLPDLYRGSSITVLGRFTGSGKTVIALEGTLNGKKQSYEYAVELPEEDTDGDYIPSLWAARRIGHLLEQIRLSGESAQMRDEVASLAREHGIITPYTTYLIHEDERSRVARRELNDDQLTLGAMKEEVQPLLKRNKGEYDSMKNKSGSGSVIASRETRNLQNAMNYSQARQGNSRLSYRDAAGNQRNLSQQVKNIQGRALYNAGKFWVDAMAQSTKAGAAVKIAFGSARYFKLLKDHPESAKFLSLGKNVRFVVKGVLYEVYE